jgi:uncharacterized membrane protein YphA (DoxX/SURF4 family)
MNENSTSSIIADLSRRFDHIDARITGWMARWGLLLLRISLGVVYLWFGLLKFFPGLSPAAGLATRTIEQLTFGLIPAETALLLLAVWETLIGLGLIFGVWMRITLLLLFVQMLGTITPVFFFPQEVFTAVPYAPTLEGQYIIKNMVIISAALVLGATVRGGAIVADPQALRRTKTKENR